MVDVGSKAETERVAVASGRVRMTAEAFALVSAGGLAKGDVEAVARLAGIQAAKRTAELIPLCHTLPLSHVGVDVIPDPRLPGLQVRTTVRCRGRTGVEMEALVAASIALMVVYDMAKAVDRGMVIEEIRLEEKSGGASGDYRRGESS